MVSRQRSSPEGLILVEHRIQAVGQPRGPHYAFLCQATPMDRLTHDSQ